MEQDLDKSVEKIVLPVDRSQDITDDPIPALIEQMNKFRSRIPEACQELFDKLKASYHNSFIDFDTLGKKISCRDIQTKYIANLYLKERVVGNMTIPHFEFDDDINEQFSKTVGATLCSSLAHSVEQGQQTLDSFRKSLGISMAACYYLPNITKLGRGFEREVLQLWLFEEVVQKATSGPNALMDYQTKFMYSGDQKQKPGSLLDHRYLSCLLHFDIEEAQNGVIPLVNGILAVLIDHSVVEMKATAIKRQKQQAKAVAEANQKKQSQPTVYLDRLKKYHDLYQSSARYDEKVIQRLFFKMDIDGDGKISKDDLWSFCQKHNVLVKKEVVATLRSKLTS